jgi:hypothetical protein
MVGEYATREMSTTSGAKVAPSAPTGRLSIYRCRAVVEQARNTVLLVTLNAQKQLGRKPS